MMNKYFTCSKQDFYMQINQTCQDPNEKREKRGLLQRARRWRRRGGRKEEEEERGGQVGEERGWTVAMRAVAAARRR